METAMSNHIVAYYRVSTQEQGRSGLGLEAQLEAVHRFATAEGMHVVHEFTEVETGKGSDALDRRPQLAQALRIAKRLKASLTVAKLDRLSRNVHFISGLAERGTTIIVAALGRNVPTLMLHVYAALAEEERRMISERTKAALQAAKARGTKLGNQAQADANREAAAARDASLHGILLELRGRPLAAIAAELTNRGIAAPRGGAWNQVTVMRMLRRLEARALTTGH
jgi:DNA invertase Pin-like site-specific DNA recombinase